MSVTLADLPKEIIMAIFNSKRRCDIDIHCGGASTPYLDDIYALRETCKAFRDAADTMGEMLGLPGRKPNWTQVVSRKEYLSWCAGHEHFRLHSWMVPCSIYRGSFEVTKFLYDSGCEFGVDAWDAAVEEQQFHTVKWLARMGVPVDYTVMFSCIGTDNLKMYKYLEKAVGPSVREHISSFTDAAVQTGKPRITKYLLSTYAMEDAATPMMFIFAILSGNVKVVSYVRDRFINDLQYHVDGLSPSSTLACLSAATFGRLEVLKWLRKNNYAWNSDVAASAEENGYVEVVGWCLDNGLLLAADHETDAFD